jgi:hypothetical protein
VVFSAFSMTRGDVIRLGPSGFGCRQRSRRFREDRGATSTFREKRDTENGRRRQRGAVA